MPLGPQQPLLARGFEPLFDPRTTPETTLNAAKIWAKAYTDYVVAAGIPTARPKQALLAVDLATAFNPQLLGAGIPLFIVALTTFWIGLVVPYIPSAPNPAVATVLVPTGILSSSQPDDATSTQQADGLAATISAFTLNSVKVTASGALVPLQ